MLVWNVAEILTFWSEERDPANTPVIYYGDAEKHTWPHLNFARRSFTQKRFYICATAGCRVIDGKA
jgi:hypothetical protein